MGGELKSSFVKGAQEPTMLLRLTRERAAAVLSKSFDADDFTPWEKSFDTGVFYVGYLPANEKSAFYKKMVGLGKSVPKKPKHKFDDVIQNLSDTNEARDLFGHLSSVGFAEGKKQNHGYLFVVKPGDQGYLVNVRDSKGLKLPRDNAKSDTSLSS